MRRMRDAVLAGMMIGALVALASGCGGSASSPQSPVHSSAAPKSTEASSGTASGAPAGPPPAGYRWVGSAAQGVWFAVPDNWAAVNLAKVSVGQALSRFALKGLGSNYLRAVLAELSQRHAIFVADLASAVRSAHHFATNGNGFCEPTALEPGASSSSALRSLARAQYAQLHAHVLAINSATIDGDPEIKAEFTITTTAGVTLSQAQYTVLSKASRLCYVTLTTDNPAAFRRVFNKTGGTIHVS